MSVYNEILSWSQNKPDFIRDALRRLITNTSLTEQDIDELVSLVKKENKDITVTINPIPICSSHIPNVINAGTAYPKLKGIKNTVNICALHEGSELLFSPCGLTVVYGNNGTGKSSYSRILKKLCWSRNPRVELKKNVFFPSPKPQQVDFVIDSNGVDINFQWMEGSESHPDLRTIFVYDTDCGDIYVNNENPTEYKPVGVDLLEKLIPVLTLVSQKITAEIGNYTTQKVNLPPSFISTSVAQWYADLESKERSAIDDYIQFSAEDEEKRNSLLKLINTSNPQQVIQDLSNLKLRVQNIYNNF